MRIIVQLLEKNGLSLKWKKARNAIVLGNKEFRPDPSPEDVVELPSSRGILLHHSTLEQRSQLRDRNINYLDPRGYLHMYLGQSERIIIEDKPTKKKAR